MQTDLSMFNVLMSLRGVTAQGGEQTGRAAPQAGPKWVRHTPSQGAGKRTLTSAFH